MSRTALVHDWLTGMRGGEKCLEVLCELYPEAPIYTLVAFPDSVSDSIRRHQIHTSFLQKMPFIRQRYRYYLPLFPKAIESFDMNGYDLIISSSHAVAKGIRPGRQTLHISYIHTPMRYVWDMFDQYFSRQLVGSVLHGVARLVARKLRKWDVRSSDRTHWMIANSEFVQSRIKRFYNREADVIHPPVDTKRFRTNTVPGSYYLVVSALVPYKRVDLAVRAFNELSLPLRVIGDGPELSHLRSIAGENVTFEGWAEDALIEEAYQHCLALVFPGEEDFGIVPVEAMASGKPVIAYGKGGATETVLDGSTGVFFHEQNTQSLIDAVRRVAAINFDSSAIRAHALTFDVEVFRTSIRKFIAEKQEEWIARGRVHR